MPDNLTAEQRRRTMQSIQSKNTKSELRTRSFLHAMGFRFRLHDHSLPGKPDIVLKKHRTAVFVHGCFWHQHGCARSVVPKTNQTYWIPKLQANVARTRFKQLNSSPQDGMPVVLVSVIVRTGNFLAASNFCAVVKKSFAFFPSFPSAVAQRCTAFLN